MPKFNYLLFQVISQGIYDIPFTITARKNYNAKFHISEFFYYTNYN